MNATISMGVPAHNPLQALARLLPTGKPSHSIPLYSRPSKATNRLQLVTAETGITAYRNGSPVAWVVPGYHRSTETGVRCDFVDVAYIRETRNGINLESHDFDTLEEAISFLNVVLGGAV